MKVELNDQQFNLIMGCLDFARKNCDIGQVRDIMDTWLVLAQARDIYSEQQFTKEEKEIPVVK